MNSSNDIRSTVLLHNIVERIVHKIGRASKIENPPLIIKDYGNCIHVQIHNGEPTWQYFFFIAIISVISKQNLVIDIFNTSRNELFSIFNESRESDDVYNGNDGWRTFYKPDYTSLLTTTIPKYRL